MKSITVKQPWSHLICAGIKDIENRTWKTNYRGRVLIHAGKSTLTWDSFVSYISNKLHNDNARLQKVIRENCFRKSWLQILETSAIIGSVEIVGCVLNHHSIWAERSKPIEFEKNGHPTKYEKKIYNWVLANPILFKEPILNVKGKLGLWNYETEVTRP